MRNRKFFVLTFLFVLLLQSLAQAKVDSVHITSREIVLDGKLFGGYGPWELIQGRVYFSWDPANPMNQQIVDLELADRNEMGLVTGSSKLVVLKPVEGSPSAETALVEVSNRGGKFTPSYFNRATDYSMAPGNENWFGDALTLRKGLTVIWVGWQFDVPDRNNNLTYEAPLAHYPDGSTITGLVRSDWVVDQTVNNLKLGHRDQRGYPVYDFDSEMNVLTVRDGREADRQVIPRSQWQFAQEKNGRVVADSFHIYMQAGFQEGKIYELVYQSFNPPVVGTGMAVIRDIISYAKYDENSAFPVKKGIAAGVSQTGRFLRHFLYQNFNTDEQFRKAYDGLMIMTAGAGRGSFNHRFAQPSRDAHRYSAFFYPTDIFPFTSSDQFDPLQWKTDGLWSHISNENHQPKTFYINTGYEYWGRAASLIHTDVFGENDIKPNENERIYHIGSGQHFVDRFPPSTEKMQNDHNLYQGNPLAFKVNYRALLVKLVDWINLNQAPPEDAYPTIEKNTLVHIDNYQFPDIPGVKAPDKAHVAYRVDYGPRWKNGIIDHQPPNLGSKYPSMVSAVDRFGNEVAGIQNVEVRVPVATYTPWSLRTNKKGSPEELVDFRGYVIPFPKTKEERSERNDPRISLEERYESKNAYLTEVENAARSLQKEGFLLHEDIRYVLERSEKYWDWIHKE
jgi:hypothetical protein